MMIGCGYCVKTIRRGRYLYFWHYEDRDDHREQVEDYIGPSTDPRAREMVVRRGAAHADRARGGVGRLVPLPKAEVATAEGGSLSLSHDNKTPPSPQTDVPHT